MKKLKIKGVTGTPVFLTRWRGFIDAKRHAIATEGERCDSNYIHKTLCSRDMYLGGLYGDLETQTFGRHMQSAELVTQYLNVIRQLKAPDPSPNGKTISMQKRNAAKIAAARPNLQRRLAEIQSALADIEEDIGRAVNETKATQRAAAALTGSRIQAYLHGAALALGKPADLQFDTVETFDPEAEFHRRHAENDSTRRGVLAKIAKEVAENEMVS